MSASFTQANEQTIERLLTSGRFANKSEVIRAGLRLLEDHETLEEILRLSLRPEPEKERKISRASGSDHRIRYLREKLAALDRRISGLKKEAAEDREAAEWLRKSNAERIKIAAMLKSEERSLKK
jgi:putative addiction module CopG family antidote